MKNLVLLHNSVKNESELINSFKKEDCNVKYVSDFETVEKLIENIDNFENYSNLAFVYHNPGYCNLPFFEDNKIIKSTYVYFNDNIINLISKFNKGVNIDIISCNLNNIKYKDEVKQIEDDLKVNIRYSLNQTGNNPSGDWIMESDDTDIKEIYFNENINNWKGVLTSAINLASLNQYIDILTNTPTTGKTTYKLKQNVKWYEIVGRYTTNYIQLQQNEIFDGDNHTIDLTGYYYNSYNATTGQVTYDLLNTTTQISGFNGIFATGGTDILNASQIINLGVLNGSGTGFIVRNNQSYVRVDNCYSTGVINNYGGGICGTSVGGYGGSIIISNCYSTGGINTGSGGICGQYAGRGSGSCKIINCYSTGEISNGGGGICSSYAGSNGKCIINNSYSTGNIGESGGGICGSNAGDNNGSCIITNCYSTGNINRFSGGICGYSAANTNGSCIITNCYSSGSIIGSMAGGICGSQAGSSSGLCKINNCYSTGNITAQDCGGICGFNAGSSQGKCIIQNCYSTGSGYMYSAGICGGAPAFNSGICAIQNCYSTGTGVGFGGICPPVPFINLGTCTIQNCYSQGTNFLGPNQYTINNNNLTSSNYLVNGNYSITELANGANLINNASYLNNAINIYNNEGNAFITDIYGSSNQYPLLKAFRETVWSYDNYNSAAVLNTNNQISINQDILNLENINLSDSVINQGLNTINLSDGDTVNQIIDFTSLTNDSDIKTARHALLNIIFDANPTITNITMSKSNIGLTDGPDNVKIYAPGSTIDISTITPTDAVYLNLTNSGDTYTINIDSSTTKIITKSSNGYTIDGVEYADGNTLTSLIPGYTIIFGGVQIFPNSGLGCLTKDALILTPKGYIQITKLKAGDIVITDDKREVPIKNIYTTTVIGSDLTYPYIISKDSIAKNYPPEEIKLSRGHMIKYNNNWIHPKNSNMFIQDKSEKIISYYHVELSNYKTDNLIINNGTIVESLANIKNVSDKQEYKNRIRNAHKLKKYYLVKSN